MEEEPRELTPREILEAKLREAEQAVEEFREKHIDGSATYLQADIELRQLEERVKRIKSEIAGIDWQKFNENK